MSRRVFTFAVLLLVLVMMRCNAGVAAEAEEHSSESKFEWKDIKDEGVTVESLGAPGLLKVGSDVFAVAEAQCKNGETSVFTGIASQIITIDNANTPMEVLKNAKKDTQVLEESISGKEKKKVDVSRPTTIVEGSNIYILVGKHSHETADNCQAKSEKIKSGMLLVKGEVVKGGNTKIRWNETGVLPCTLGAKHDSLSQLIFGGGSGVKLRDATFLFPVEATKKKDEKDVKTASLIIHNAASWKLSKGMSDDGCGVPSVVEWKDKLIMMTACDDGRRRVYEIGDKWNSWTEALGTLSRVWGNKQGNERGVRSGFITATIDNRNVMLVTLPVYAKETEKEDNGKGKLHLWLTDNTHIVDIGPVSGEREDVTASSLLYKSGKSGENKKEELIALYEKKNGDADTTSHSLWSVRLTAELQRVKEVLAAWKEVDERVSSLCPSTAAKDAPTGNACATDKITDGLVGFLSGNFSDKTWSDEYLGVNATVKKEDAGETEAALHEGSVKFTGAWAEWPVGRQGENQLYHFANYKFTLVATVSVDGVPQGDTSISLMGAKMNDNGNSILFGLSYDKEKKWKVLCGGENSEDQSVTLATETTHHVVILLRNGTQGSAYVDGQRVGRDEACDLKNTEDKKISHFYIGGDGGAKGVSGVQDVSVTVTNVLLYNRPLDDEEIAALTKNKITNPKREVPKTSTTSPLSPAVSGSDVQGTVPLSNSAGQLQSEQGQPKGSIAAGAGGTSTPATSTAAASSGQKPVKQPTSGTSPSGNKNADGTPSSDADPTVVTVGEETIQGDGTLQTPEVSVNSGANGERVGGTDVQQEGIHTHNGEVNDTALNSSLGNVSQGNNSDAGSVRGSGLLPSLLLLLGLWVFAAL